MFCPKCYQGISIDFWKLCPEHDKEYNTWLHDEYDPIPCACGSDSWEDGTLQMTNPPSFPLALVYRCKNCEGVQLEISNTEQKRIRIRIREEKKTRQEEPSG